MEGDFLGQNIDIALHALNERERETSENRTSCKTVMGDLSECLRRARLQS